MKEKYQHYENHEHCSIDAWGVCEEDFPELSWKNLFLVIFVGILLGMIFFR